MPVVINATLQRRTKGRILDGMRKEVTPTGSTLKEKTTAMNAGVR